jgi:hypothetical protein
MVQFLRNYESGINAVVLVLNGESDGLAAGVQIIIRLLHAFFNDTQFWDYFCIVVTKWDAVIDPSPNLQVSTCRNLVKNLAIECAGPTVADISIPVFFVNSRSTVQQG